MSTKNAARTTKSAKVRGKKYSGFGQGERDAMKARVEELKAEARPDKSGGDKAAAAEIAVLAAIAKMPQPYRAMGGRLHAVIKTSAPALAPKTWYGLPAYAKDGKIVCYLRMNPKSPYNDRYMTFGFNETA